MVMRVVWSTRFRDELRREVIYLKARNPAVAEEVRQRIVKSVRRLQRFPEAGRAWRLAGSRELVIPGLPYIVIYKITTEAIVVASLFHASREVPHVH